MRCTIAPRKPDEHIVLILMHHTVMDGWSFGQLWKDVMATYKEELEGNGAIMDLPVQYADYAAWEHKQLEVGSARYSSLASFWKESLAGATPVVQLPLDLPRPEHPPVAPSNIAFTYLEANVVTGLKRLAAESKASLYSVCMAAYRVMVCEFGGTDDIIIASSFSVRPPGTEKLVRSNLVMPS